MKNKVLMFSLLIIVFQPCTLLFSHGVTARVDTGAIVVMAMYDTAEAMSYAKVTILAPGENLKFQSGRTDRNGRFCFFPDRSGDWTVVVDDEMGHRLEVGVPVDEAMALHANQGQEYAEQGTLSRLERAIMGISIIFGISGILFWWWGRKARA